MNIFPILFEMPFSLKDGDLRHFQNMPLAVFTVFYNVKVFMRGWLGYYGIADMKTDMERWNEWLRRRIRMYIWKQWKLPRTRVANLKKLGMPDWMAYRNGNTRKGYWAVAGSGILTHTITNERLARRGYYDISEAYKSLHSL